MYLATVLLEANRWSPAEEPAFSWGEDTGARITEAGFSGVELWQGHWLQAGEEQKRWMRASGCPIRIFSRYGVPCDRPDELLFEVVDALADTLRGIKFNLGSDAAGYCSDHRALTTLAESLPGRARLLCECHAGTVLESPESAASAMRDWPGRIGAIVHPFAESPCEEWFEALGERISHLHLQCRADGTWADPVPSRETVQCGLATLRAHHFTGTASLEFIEAIRRETDPDVLLAAAAEVRSTWSSVPPAWSEE